MAIPETAQQVQTLAQEIIGTPIGELVHNRDWGSINFERAIPDLERLNSFVTPLTVLPLELLPQHVAGQIATTLRNMNSVVDRIRQFTIDIDSPVSTRDGICQELANQVDQAYPVVSPHIPFLAYARGDVQRNIDELVRSVDQANAIVTEAKDDITNKQGELDTIIAAAREASVKAGVAHFTHDFSNEANIQSNNATLWLLITAAFALVTALAALYTLFIDLPPTATIPMVINRLSSKLVFLGLLLAATIWCGRLYKAAKHQETVNRHRANALKTFQAFIQAASTEPVREAVLMETTRSIFMLTPSGYLDGNDGGGDGGTKVVEVVKNLSQAAAAGSKP